MVPVLDDIALTALFHLLPKSCTCLVETKIITTLWKMGAGHGCSDSADASVHLNAEWVKINFDNIKEVLYL